MYKLITIILAAMPVILFLRTIFIGQLKRSQAVSDFRKQIDYLVWIILILIVCGLVYSLGNLPEGCTIFRAERGSAALAARKHPRCGARIPRRGRAVPDMCPHTYTSSSKPP